MMISSKEWVLLSECVFALLTPRLRLAGASFFTPQPPYQPLGWSYRYLFPIIREARTHPFAEPLTRTTSDKTGT